jgi:hypothetical protein
VKKTAVIMQPTYLPWIGYFDLMDQADVFVFLDNAQLSTKSWHVRNRIVTPKGLQWLSVPVRHAGRSPQELNTAEIVAESGYVRKHQRSIEVNYRRAPYFDVYFVKFCKILTQSGTSLTDLNIGLIKWIADEIGIETRFETSSVLGERGTRSGWWADICRRVGANRYISPDGSLSYLAEDVQGPASQRIELYFHNYEHPTYRQVYRPFVPYAAAIDLLFNEGERSLEVIRSGRRPPVPASEAFRLHAAATARNAFSRGRR